MQTSMDSNFYSTLTNLYQIETLQTEQFSHYIRTILTISNDDEHIVSIHFGIHQYLNIQEIFEFEKKELIQDIYFQSPKAGLTIELNIWLKCRLRHDYSSLIGTEIINTFESVVIKKETSKEVSQKLEITKKQFKHVIMERFNDEEVVFDLDMVQTMRLIFQHKENPSIKLILASTMIGEKMFYNHGTIQSNQSNESLMIHILNTFRDRISFPQSSPVLLRLKHCGTLPDPIKFKESNEDSSFFTEKGYYFDDEEEEEFEEFHEDDRQALLNKLEQIEKQLLNNF